MAYADPDIADDEVADRLTLPKAFDWRGGSLSGEQLSRVLQLLSSSGADRSATLYRARVIGRVLLHEVGARRSLLNLQILTCQLDGGFSARQSAWRQLIFAHTEVEDVDLVSCRVERILALERVRARGRLELRDAVVGGSLALSGSSWKGSEGRPAANLVDAQIGGNLIAPNLHADGGLVADRLQVGSDLVLDSATLSAGTDGRALGLAQARIGGRLRLTPAFGARFTASDRVHMESAKVGALLASGALLDGLGDPAIVADMIEVDETVDLSGRDGDEGARFHSKGALRFGSSRIGGQFQAHLCDLEAVGDALVLQNARIEGDVLLGSDPAGTVVSGTANLTAVRIGGRLVLQHVSFPHKGDALAVRHAIVAGDVECFDVTAHGPLRLDGLSAAGLSLQQVRLDRDLPTADPTGLPEAYAHAEHALLDLNFAKLASDLRVEDLALRGGDMRMIGARIGATAQLSRIDIIETPGAALIAQSATIGGGLQIAGSPSSLARIEGEIAAMNLRVDEDVTLVHVRIGTPGSPVNAVLRSASVRSGVTLSGVELHGTLVVSAADIKGDFSIQASTLSKPDAAVLDLRGASIGGTLQLASTGAASEPNCRVDGQLALQGATVGTLSWRGLRVGPRSVLDFARVTVRQTVSAHRLIAEGPCGLSLDGTTAPLLDDELADDLDGWGAGSTTLSLNEFAYGRLVDPSGRGLRDAASIRLWRGKWLARCADAASEGPRRHLANVLRMQGLSEASRLQLVEAFSAEGRQRPTPGGRALAWLFGALFGHGLSGSRAALTLLAAWALGTAGVLHLQERHLLVPAKRDEKPAVPCADADPMLFAADAMLPVDLGVNAGCRIGRGPRSHASIGIALGGLSRRILGELEVYRFAAALYQLVSWVLVSLAVLTWSGLLKRGGRE